MSELSAIIENTTASIGHILPECWLFATLLLLIVAELVLPKRYPEAVLCYIFMACMLLEICLLWFWGASAPDEQFALFGNLLISNQYARGFRLVLATGALMFGLFQQLNLPAPTTQSKNRGEVYILVSGVLLGLQLLVLSNHFLIMYLSLETASIGSYALVLYSMRRKSAEAAAKYVLFGIFSSAMMLYGISLIYGLSESLFFTDVLPQEAASPLLMIGMGLTLAGLLFKVAASPFHIWTPDVYEGAPVSVVAFFSVVPKAAGFAVLLRLANFFAMQESFFTMLAVVALVSLLIGNLAALWQQGARRLMAYSSIAHAGFILAGVVGQATEAVFYYTAVYTFINLSAFAIIALAEWQKGTDAAESFAGIGRRDFLQGLVLVIAMAALIGLPPTSGFMAKLLVFSALWEMWEISAGFYIPLLFFAGIISTVVSAFFYLRLPYFAFFRNDSGHQAPLVPLALKQKLILLLFAIPVIVFFLIASRLMELI